MADRSTAPGRIALMGLVVAGAMAGMAGAASAQYYYYDDGYDPYPAYGYGYGYRYDYGYAPRPPAVVPRAPAAVSPYSVNGIAARRYGLVRIERSIRRDDTYIVDGVTAGGQRQRLILDAYAGELIRRIPLRGQPAPSVARAARARACRAGREAAGRGQRTRDDRAALPRRAACARTGEARGNGTGSGQRSGDRGPAPARQTGRAVARRDQSGDRRRQAQAGQPQRCPEHRGHRAQAAAIDRRAGRRSLVDPAGAEHRSEPIDAEARDADRSGRPDELTEQQKRLPFPGAFRFRRKLRLG